mmetsp:Transcript_63321/g.100588  ORF Transcript_63321/g.100588 Transcript_63321/m.100588 type:complete len:114 (-) Transcript_63321:122-463(-)
MDLDYLRLIGLTSFGNIEADELEHQAEMLPSLLTSSNKASAAAEHIQKDAVIHEKTKADPALELVSETMEEPDKKDVAPGPEKALPNQVPKGVHLNREQLVDALYGWFGPAGF